jgi:phosphoheptose isomerase
LNQKEVELFSIINQGDNLIFQRSTYFDQIQQAVTEFANLKEIKVALKILRKCHEDDNQVFLMGNGGSSAIAQHFSVDWSKGILQSTGKALRTNCLSNNPAILTAISNDISFEDVYATQLQYFAKKGDVAVIISSSGKSVNMLKAAEYAAQKGIVSICLSGFGGSILGKMGTININLSSTDIQVIEDVHNLFGHYVLKNFSNTDQQL